MNSSTVWKPVAKPRAPDRFAGLGHDLRGSSELTRVRAAIANLSVEPTRRKTSKRRKKQTRKKGRGVTRAQVLGCMERLLSSEKTMRVTKLERLVRDNFRNRKLSGFSLRLREALTDGRFEKRGQSFRLKK